MKRFRSPKDPDADAKILARLREIKADHPFWGYRRAWSYLTYVDQISVNKKRVLRLMRQNALLVTPNLRLKAKRTSTKSKPKATRPNEWWGIDMTKVMIDGFGWLYLVIVLDWHTKKIVGYYAGMQSKAAHWLAALNMAVNRQFPDGVRGQELHLMSDNGCQPTAESFMQACRSMDINQAFTSYNNPKGNADTERMMRTIKEELVWLKEWRSPFDFASRFQVWAEVDYNQNYRHSTLKNKTPLMFEKEQIDSRKTQLASA